MADTCVSSLLQVLRDSHAGSADLGLPCKEEKKSPTSSCSRDRVAPKQGLLQGRHDTKKRPRLTARVVPVLGEAAEGGEGETDGLSSRLGLLVTETVKRPFFWTDILMDRRYCFQS